jgi:phosphoribosylcarboxyaminoimidazole (NCAIR) mutase
VDGSANAALLAIAILALEDEALTAQLAAYRRELTEKTLG